MSTVYAALLAINVSFVEANIHFRSATKAPLAHPRLTHPVKTFPGGPRWKIYPKKPSPVVPGEFSPVFLDPGENPF